MSYNIVYINEIHTTVNDYKKFGCDYFIEKGHHVEVWDLNNIIFGTLYVRTDDMSEEKNNIVFNTFAELKKRLKSINVRETFFIFLAGYVYRNVENYIKIFIFFHGGKYCNCFISPTLMLQSEKSNETCGLNTIGRFNNRKINFLLVQRILKNRLIVIENYIIAYLCTPTFNFAATKTIYNTYSYNKVGNIKKTRLIHTIDYDKILEVSSETSKEYLVFIDDGFGIHPDEIRQGEKVEKHLINHYYIQMTQLFEQVESVYNKVVVIAAHPRVKYKGNEFGNRKIVYFDTINLVRKAELVIMHFSVSLNFVVWYKKPFLTVANNYMINNMSRYVKTWQIYWGVKTYNIEKDQEPIKYICNYSVDIYDKYVEQYIKMEGTPQRKFFECVHEYIERYMS